MVDYFSNIASRNSEFSGLNLVSQSNLNQNNEQGYEIILDETKAPLEQNKIENKIEHLEKNSLNQIINKNIFNEKTINYFSNTIDRNAYNYSGNKQVILQSIEEKNNFENTEIIKNSTKLNTNNVTNSVLKNIENNEININNSNNFEVSQKSEKVNYLEDNSTKNDILPMFQHFENKNEPPSQLLLPQIETNTSEKKSLKIESPKLIIGKINVEILPNSLPTKQIINKIVQAPPAANYSKMNRLKFGLGQL